MNGLKIETTPFDRLMVNGGEDIFPSIPHGSVALTVYRRQCNIATNIAVGTIEAGIVNLTHLLMRRLSDD
ncbi:MAG: hypothetical protein ABIH70_05470 [Chloroflexota bacterium]